jgi:hypothetical protein
MKTQQQRAEQRRQEKLAQIQEQVEDGSLVIRQMTPEERKANPPRPAPQKRPKRR